MIDGVCAGFAEYVNWDPTLVRILWMGSVFVLNGLGIVAYLAAMFILPSDKGQNEGSGTERKSPDAKAVIGILLILFGFFFLAHNWGWYQEWPLFFPFHHFQWFLMPWDYWPILLVLLGIAYIVYVLRQNKSKSESSNVDGSASGQGKRLLRSTHNKIVGGICGGLAQYFDIDVTIVRIGIVILAVATNFFFWVVLYGIALAFLPSE